jgi:ABC-2 type transport system ATP-binding protein
MLCGLLTPDEGSGTCLGFDLVQGRTEIQSRIGYMTQKFSLYDDLTIEENLLFIARMYRMKDPDAAAEHALEDLGLVDRRNQIAGTLSGGWKQRLALGACTMHKPELLLLDEPTAGVDPKARRVFWDEIHRIASTGTTVLVSTHYMDEAERCHRLAYLARGKLLAQGTAEELVESSGLATWEISGEDIPALAEALAGQPGVEMVAPFGDRLHVSGAEVATLRNTVLALADKMGGKDLTVKEIPPGLEDVFIHFISGSENPGDGRSGPHGQKI